MNEGRGDNCRRQNNQTLKKQKRKRHLTFHNDWNHKTRQKFEEDEQRI